MSATNDIVKKVDHEMLEENQRLKRDHLKQLKHFEDRVKGVAEKARQKEEASMVKLNTEHENNIVLKSKIDAEEAALGDMRRESSLWKEVANIVLKSENARKDKLMKLSWSTSDGDSTTTTTITQETNGDVASPNAKQPVRFRAEERVQSPGDFLETYNKLLREEDLMLSQREESKGKVTHSKHNDAPIPESLDNEEVNRRKVLLKLKQLGLPDLE